MDPDNKMGKKKLGCCREALELIIYIFLIQWKSGMAAIFWKRGGEEEKEKKEMARRIFL